MLRSVIDLFTHNILCILISNFLPLEPQDSICVYLTFIYHSWKLNRHSIYMTQQWKGFMLSSIRFLCCVSFIVVYILILFFFPFFSFALLNKSDLSPPFSDLTDKVSYKEPFLDTFLFSFLKWVIYTNIQHFWDSFRKKNATYC